jgi:hypothetical protein
LIDGVYFTNIVSQSSVFLVQVAALVVPIANRDRLPPLIDHVRHKSTARVLALGIGSRTSLSVVASIRADEALTVILHAENTIASGLRPRSAHVSGKIASRYLLRDKPFTRILVATFVLVFTTIRELYCSKILCFGIEDHLNSGALNG